MPDAVLILLAPPSMEELEARLRGRATEDEASIAERLAEAVDEMEQGDRFDHVVVNDEVGRPPMKSLLSSNGHAPADLRFSSDRSASR